MGEEAALWSFEGELDGMMRRQPVCSSVSSMDFPEKFRECWYKHSPQRFAASQLRGELMNNFPRKDFISSIIIKF